jgi:hypothetical protein
VSGFAEFVPLLICLVISSVRDGEAFARDDEGMELLDRKPRLKPLKT